MKSGVHVDQTKLTGGINGLERLVKGHLSASWMVAALRSWADDVVCLERDHKKLS